MIESKPEAGRWGGPLTSPQFDGYVETLIVCMLALLLLVAEAMWLAS